MGWGSILVGLSLCRLFKVCVDGFEFRCSLFEHHIQRLAIAEGTVGLADPAVRQIPVVREERSQSTVDAEQHGHAFFAVFCCQ